MQVSIEKLRNPTSYMDILANYRPSVDNPFDCDDEELLQLNIIRA